MHRTVMGRQSLETFVSATGDENAVAIAFEDFLGHVPQHGIVFDHHDGFRPPVSLAGALPSGDRFSVSVGGGKKNFEGRPLIRFAVEPDIAVVLLDDAVNGGQP